MPEVQRELDEAPASNLFLEVVGRVELPERALDRDLPPGHGAHVHHVGGVDEAFARLAAKVRWIGETPE